MNKDSSYDEKNYQLFINQIKMLNDFRDRGAISQEQFEISYRGLIEKTGFIDSEK